MMAVIGLAEAELEVYLKKVNGSAETNLLTIGCFNSPKNLTVTGTAALVDALKALLDNDGIFARKLRVDVAYHSSFMSQVADEYEAALRDLQPAVGHPSAVMVSSVTGSVVLPEDLVRADYWVRNLTSPVRFSDAMSSVIAQSATSARKKLGGHRARLAIHDLVEIGPHSALQAPIREMLNMQAHTENTSYQTMLVRKESAIDTSLKLAGHLFCLGYSVNVSEINVIDPGVSQSPRLLTDLPEYPFNHSQRYWSESRLSKNHRFRQFPRNLLLGTTVVDWNSLEARWRNIIRSSENPWIEHHQVSCCSR